MMKSCQKNFCLLLMTFLMLQSVPNSNAMGEPTKPSKKSAKGPLQNEKEAIQWGKPVENAAISIRFDKEINGGLPIIATMTIKNISKKSTVSTVSTSAEKDYIFIVKDSENNVVKTSRYGKHVLTRGIFRRVFVKIPPGKQVTEKVNIGRMFDMTLHDKYTIQAYRIILRSHKRVGKSDWVRVHSNIATVTIQ